MQKPLAIAKMKRHEEETKKTESKNEKANKKQERKTERKKEKIYA